MASLGARNLCASSAVFLVIISVGFTSPTERNLYRALLSGYDRDVLPRERWQDNFTLQFEPMLRRLDIDEHGISTAYLRETYKWSDYRLTWNPEDYTGLPQVTVPIKHLWCPLPSWKLVNSLAPIEEYDDSGQARVSHTGDVSWGTAARRKASCTYVKGERAWNCTYRWASCSYPAHSLQPFFSVAGPEGMSLEAFEGETNAYEVVTNKASIRLASSGFCPEEFLEMSYYLVMRENQLVERPLSGSTHVRTTNFIMYVGIACILLFE